MSTRLNILLTHRTTDLAGSSRHAFAENQPWYQSLSRLLSPMGVRTFEATTGPAALDLIERHPIHLAVVDTRLQDTDGLAVLRVIQKIRERAQAADYWQAPNPPAAEPTPSYRVQVRMDQGPQGKAQRIEVRFETAPQPVAPPSPVWPTVILVTPNRDEPAVLQEALQCNAFSVMSEPVNLELMLDVMARAMKRFHHNLWPQ